MRNYVIINGVNSLTIQGLAINNLPPITKPMIRTQREEIDGRDGDIVTELGYSAYDKQIEIGLWGTYDINDIIKYFTGEGTIVFSNEEDKYYNFKILDQIDYEKLLKFKTATITLHCQPFKYPVEETPIEGEAITITGSGSNITLENTVVAPMEMKLKGNTLQNGTPTPDNPIPIQVVSGENSIEVSNEDNTQSQSYPISLGVENLLQFSQVIHNANGITITKNDDTILINGTATANVLPALNTIVGTGNTYNMSIKVISGSTTSTTSYIQTYAPGQVAISQKLNESGGTTATLTNGTTYNNRINIPSGAVFNNLKIKVELTEGTTPQHVSTTPIELLKIGTYQDKIDKSSGKNLINLTTFTGAFNTTTYTNMGNVLEVKNKYGSISRTLDVSSNKYTQTNTNAYDISQTWKFINLKPNTQYTVSCNVSTNMTSGNINLFGTQRAYNVGNVSTTFTTNASGEIEYDLMFYGSAGTGKYVELSNIMLNEGTTALEYEPYGTGWYVKKEIGKVVLDGSITFAKQDTWSSVGDNTNAFYKGCSAFTNMKTNETVMSDKFTYATNLPTTDIYGIYLTTNLIIRVPKSVSDATTLTTWLSTNQPIVYCPLATPTYTEIEDSTLISQLEALKPYSYNPTTNITQTNNDAPFELDVSLSYTNTMNVNNVGNIYAKPILTIEGSGTIGIILNDIEVLSVDLGTDEKITIDVPKLEAYNPDNDVLLNRNVTGDYMKLLINDGDNTIAFSGSVTSATLTNYTRWI